MDVHFFDEIIAGLDAAELEWLETRIRHRKESVNYHNLKDVACDYAKSRVASGRLTLRPD